MNIEPFRSEDIAGFLQLAGKDNWVVDYWECDLLLSAFPDGCFVARAGNGTPTGYVTAMCHERSGWIGNLIVAGDFRGQGIGEKLFMAALQALKDAKVATVWLTASQMGIRLYEKHGFTRIDTINRWTAMSKASPEPERADSITDHAVSQAISLDELAWGDRREALLSAVTGSGRSLFAVDGFVTVRQCCERHQVGPFAAHDGRTAAELLNRALALVPAGAAICLDAPAANRLAPGMFTDRQFAVSGTTELMYAGARPDYRPELIYGLATMGSCG
jgi:GNAT superfamily N-acetyltransferase